MSLAERVSLWVRTKYYPERLIPLYDVHAEAINEVVGDAGTEIASETARSATASVTVAKDDSALTAFGAWGRRSSTAKMELLIDGVVKASSTASKGHLVGYTERVPAGSHSATLRKNGVYTSYQENLFRVAIYSIKPEKA